MQAQTLIQGTINALSTFSLSALKAEIAQQQQSSSSQFQSQKLFPLWFDWYKGFASNWISQYCLDQHNLLQGNYDILKLKEFAASLNAAVMHCSELLNLVMAALMPYSGKESPSSCLSLLDRRKRHHLHYPHQHEHYIVDFNLSSNRNIFVFFVNNLKHDFIAGIKEYLDTYLMSDVEEDFDLSSLAEIFIHLEPFGIRNIAEGSMMEILQRVIEETIISNSKNQFEESKIDFYLEFLHKRLAPVVSAMFGFDSDVTNSCKTRLEFHIYRSLGFLLMQSIFDIVRDYPDSEPALLDLKRCLNQAKEETEFIISFNGILRERLLIIDARTTNILDIFLACANCLSFLELSDITQHQILSPIKKYLRSRKDVVRKILLKVLESSNPSEDLELDEGSVNNLLNIFPIPAFAKEYHNLLCEELLSMTDFEVEDQIRAVEVLKDKFGELEMSQAHVMMKDVADSRRIFNHHMSSLSTQKGGNLTVQSPLVVSNLYWPSILDLSENNPPDFVAKWRGEFESSFEHLKASRKLNWLPNAGVVDLEVTRVTGPSLRLSTTPRQASLLLLFSDKDEILFSQANDLLGCSASHLKDAVNYWSRHRVLDLVGDYIISIEATSASRMKEMTLTAMGGTTSKASKPAVVPSDKIENVWSVVEAMLTNLGPTTPAHIQNSLVMFGPAFAMTPKEFKSVMEALIELRRIEYDDITELYKIIS